MSLNNPQNSQTEQANLSPFTRGLNWVEEEDLQLTASWLVISPDSITKDSQSAETYWERVSAHFNSHIPTDVNHNRRPGALKSRWCTIKAAVSAFCSSLIYVESLHMSGISELDLMKRAQEHFKKGSTTKKRFSMEGCWEVLKDEPKWLTILDAEKKKAERLASKKKASESSSSRPVETENPELIAGNKRKRDTMVEKIGKKLLETMDQFNSMMDASVLSIDIDKIADNRAKMYYLEKQQQFLDKWEAEKEEGSDGRLVRKRRIIADDVEDKDESEMEDVVEEVAVGTIDDEESEEKDENDENSYF